MTTSKRLAGWSGNRQPDLFGSEDHDSDLSKWQDFCVNLKAWLFLGNPKFEVDLHRAESHKTGAIDVSAEPEDVQLRCKQFYNIMTGLLRGKPLRMLWQIENRNGYELWRQLGQLFAPKDESQVYFSVVCIASCAPVFERSDFAGSSFGLERLRAEYAKSSGTDVPDDLMLSVLVRSLPRHIQQHVQLQMDETSSYEDIRSLVIGYEKITSWSPGKIHSELGIVSPPNLGPAPMEVDLVSTYPKGKGKQKGKPGKGTQKGKDGGKSKGSQGQKGNKGSSAGKDGKGKGSSTTATCFHCGKPGHTKRDCWQLNGRPGSKKVSIVSADDGASVSGSTTGSTTSSVPTSASTAGNSGNANSVRFFSSTVTIEEVPESDSDGDVIDLTAYKGGPNSVSKNHISFRCQKRTQKLVPCTCLSRS